MKTRKQSATNIILIVEDDEGLGEVLSLAVDRETSYQAVLATDGQQGLQAAQALQPALVITDYQLPSLNGLQLLDRLHARPELEELPALLISANLPKRELAQRGLIGIEKPFDLKTLLQAIAHVLPSV